MKILSSAFGSFDSIPSKYTTEGDNISPPLSWQDIPADTKSLALICEDPDAPMGTWDHWILYNIPPTVSELPEGLQTLQHGMQTNLNSWRKPGYGGPNPPSGSHRYFFILYALDTVLQLSSHSNKADLLKAIQGHILEETSLVGVYELKHPR